MVDIHLENREIREMSKKMIVDEKVREIHEKLSKSGKNEIIANIFENVDIAC